jgi:hypothetical protein
MLGAIGRHSHHHPNRRFERAGQPDDGALVSDDEINAAKSKAPRLV